MRRVEALRPAGVHGAGPGAEVRGAGAAVGHGGGERREPDVLDGLADEGEVGGAAREPGLHLGHGDDAAVDLGAVSLGR